MTWGAGGSTSKLTLELTLKLKKMGLEPNMHLTCTNVAKDDVVRALKACREAGVQNIVALRGDPPLGQDKWEATDASFTCALDLVKFIRAEHGDYFNISVAGYPEGHPDAIDVAPEAMSAAEKLRCRVAPDGTVTVCSDASFRAELDYLKSKVDAGADMIITQMFFDVAVYAAFVTACRQHGIHCPIVPGIMVLQAAPGFKKMTKFCKTRVPPALGSKVDALSDDDVKLKQFGVDFGVETCNQLRALNAPGLHFYTLNLENSTLAIVDKLGLGAHNKTNGNGKHTTSSNGKTADDDAKTLSRPGLVTYAALAALIAAVAVALRSHTRA